MVYLAPSCEPLRLEVVLLLELSFRASFLAFPFLRLLGPLLLPLAAIGDCAEAGVDGSSDNFHPHVIAACESPVVASMISQEFWSLIPR